MAWQAASQPHAESPTNVVSMGAEKVLVDEEHLQARVTKAAKLIAESSALLITSGAGLGVDSGLPDFRGPEGFWKAYPPMKALGLKFPKMSNPVWFSQDPQFAWGFWGHRYKLYSTTTPHTGFEILKRLAESKISNEGYFVYTSNVDGAFYKAGFDTSRVIECHGSVHWLQCTEECTSDVWSADSLNVQVDETTFRAADPLPKCKNCNKLARPNVLMYYDTKWIEDRYTMQDQKYHAWMDTLTQETKLVVLEIGAGTAIPTVREESERRAFKEGWKGSLIRINLRDSDVPFDGISLPLGGKDAFERIEKEIGKLGMKL